MAVTASDLAVIAALIDEMRFGAVNRQLDPTYDLMVAKQTERTLKLLARRLAVYFEQTNPRFSREKWDQATGFLGNTHGIAWLPTTETAVAGARRKARNQR